MAMVINEEQQMLKESAQGFLAEFAPVSALRKLRDEGSDVGYSVDLWRQMVDMGWAAILIPEAYGGLEFGHVGMGQIVEQTGRTLTASPLFATAIVGASLINLAGTEAQKTSLLGAIAAGELTVVRVAAIKRCRWPRALDKEANLVLVGHTNTAVHLNRLVGC